jgi:valyl-tRNA synthetase
MLKSWPHLQKQFISKSCEKQAQIIMELISSIRNIRAEWHIPENTFIECIFKMKNKSLKKLIEENQNYLKRLARIDNILIDEKFKELSGCASGVVDKIDFYIPLKKVIDIDKEKERIHKQIDSFTTQLKSLKVRLKNKEFLTKAPKEIVEREKEKSNELSQIIKRLKNNLKNLKA